MGSRSNFSHTSIWLIMSLLANVFALVPTVASATTAPNTSTNISNSTCDFVTGTAQGVNRVTANSGTAQNPFGLFSTSDFVELRRCVNEHNNSFSGKVFAVGNDIDFSGVNLVPIGDNSPSNDRFAGALEGGGRSLINIKVSTSATAEASGLFGWTNGASFRDLVISGEVLGGGSSGLLVGYASNTGTFSNIAAFASVSARAALEASQTDQVGGLIGVSRGGSASSATCSTNNLSIRNVTVDPLGGSGRVYGFGSVHGQTGAGGLVGQSMCTTISNARASIEVRFDGRGNVGGLVALSTGKTSILDSVAFGNVTSNEALLFSGWNDLNGYNNYFDFSNQSGIVGGLIGTTYPGDVYSNTHAFGNVVVTSGFAGGFAGVVYDSSISDSGGNGDVYASSRSYVGGFNGYTYTSNGVEISRAYAHGAVTGTDVIYAGGFMGAYAFGNTGMTISDSISRGKVSASSTVATSAAAGFIGAIRGSLGRLHRNIAYSDASTSAQLNRGFIGRAFNTSWVVSNNFRLNISGLADASAGTWSSTLSPASMSSISSFPNFDMSSFSTAKTGSVWMMCDAAPVLRSSKFTSDCPIVPRWHEVGPDGRTARVYYPGAVTSLGPLTSLQINGQTVSSQATLSSTVLIATLSSTIAKDAPLTATFTLDNLQPYQVQRASDNSPQSVFAYSGYGGLNLSMVPGPAVANVSPSRGYFNQGNQVILTGTNLTAATVQVDGLTVTPISNTDTQITLLIPAGSPGSTASILVTNSQGSYTVANAFFRIPAPILSAASPATSSAAGGPVIELQGQYFSGSTEVSVNGQTVSFTLISDSRITFSAPAGPPGSTASVTVATPAGSSVPLQAFFYNPLPTITALSQTASPLSGGVTVTLSGTGFATATTLSFGALATVSFSIVNDSQIRFTVPASTSPGFATLTLATANGSASSASAFRYLAAPTLLTNSPTLVTTLGGSIINLLGTGLASTTTLYVGDSTASFVVVSDTMLRFSTAQTAAGIVNVSVQTAGGHATLSQALTFTSSSIAPVVSGLSPSSGSILGGFVVTLFGQNFSGNYSTPISVLVDGVAVTSLTILEDGTLTFLVPAGRAGGAVDLIVSTGGGSRVMAGAFSYVAPAEVTPPADRFPRVPVVLSLSKRIIVGASNSLEVSGLNLANISSLWIGGIAISISSNTSTSVLLVLPELPVGTWSLVLSNDFGTLTFIDALTVVTPERVIQPKPGTLLAWRYMHKFEGNSSSLSAQETRGLVSRAKQVAGSRTVVCWAYTASNTPSRSSVSLASTRAAVVCDALARALNVKVSVRLKFGSPMWKVARTAVQFWR